MNARRGVAMVLVLSLLATGPGFLSSAGAQSAAPPPPPGAPAPAPAGDVTPARVSYLHGEVSFWRPGADEWAPAVLNTPLGPGDLLYAGQGGNVELQIGPGAFVRAANGTQIGLDNQEPGFVQLRLTGGEAAVDARQVPSGFTIEVDTPNAAFTIERAGYYRLDVGQDATTFATHRGGTATMTPAGGAAALIAPNQMVVLTGADAPQVALGAAPALTAWDNWNYQRTEYLLRPASSRYVSAGVYGAEALDQYGTWRTVETYGSVWVPAAVPTGWVPYSTGRWIWDPRFGWTWLDEAPWGWAPYHYGRWVFAGSYWAWAPGPIIVRPAYAPALVVFLGSPVAVVARPLCWAPLGWGEPVITWWGRPGFIGTAWWGGWGGPRVVNNVIVNRTTTINVTNITVYNNVHVTNAVVGVPADRFGRERVKVLRMDQAEVQRLTPVRGALEVRPVAASVMPVVGPAVKPPAAVLSRPVVATRTPHDASPALQAQGLPAIPSPAPAPRLVPTPKRVATPPQGPEPRPGRDLPPGQAPGKPSAAPRPDDPIRRPGTPPVVTPPGAVPPRVSTPPQPGTPGSKGDRPTPPPATGGPIPTMPQPGAPAPEERKRVDRPAPPAIPGAPGPAPQPGPEERKRVDRPAPPPAPHTMPMPVPGAPGPAPQPGPEERKRVDRPAPPPAPHTMPMPVPGAPGPAPQPAPEERKGRVDRPAPAMPPGPTAPAMPPGPPPSMPSPEERKGRGAERTSAPQRPGPARVAMPTHPPAYPGSPAPMPRVELPPGVPAPMAPAARVPRVDRQARTDQPAHGETKPHPDRKDKDPR